MPRMRHRGDAYSRNDKGKLRSQEIQKGTQRTQEKTERLLRSFKVTLEDAVSLDTALREIHRASECALQWPQWQVDPLGEGKLTSPSGSQKA